MAKKKALTSKQILATLRVLSKEEGQAIRKEIRENANKRDTEKHKFAKAVWTLIENQLANDCDFTVRAPYASISARLNNDETILGEKLAEKEVYDKKEQKKVTKLVKRDPAEQAEMRDERGAKNRQAARDAIFAYIEEEEVKNGKTTGKRVRLSEYNRDNFEILCVDDYHTLGEETVTITGTYYLHSAMKADRKAKWDKKRVTINEAAKKRAATLEKKIEETKKPKALAK